MKIIVCFKIIADYARLSEKDWTWDERHCVDTGFVRRIFNCFDESALEMALTLSQPSGHLPDTADLTALTVDDPQGDLFLRHLMAIGYDHAVRIQCSVDLDLRFNPSWISFLIAEYIRRNGHELVFSGIQGGDGDNWQTGLLIAERLGWPCIREVTRVIRTDEPDRLTVESRIDGAVLVQTVRLPLVLTIGQSLDAPCLRLPTLKQKLAAKKRQVTIVPGRDLTVGDNSIRPKGKTLVDLERPKTKQACVFIDGQNPHQMVRHLYDHYLKNRLNR